MSHSRSHSTPASKRRITPTPVSRSTCGDTSNTGSCDAAPRAVPSAVAPGGAAAGAPPAPAPSVPSTETIHNSWRQEVSTVRDAASHWVALSADELALLDIEDIDEAIRTLLRAKKIAREYQEAKRTKDEEDVAGAADVRRGRSAQEEEEEEEEEEGGQEEETERNAFLLRLAKRQEHHETQQTQWLSERAERAQAFEDDAIRHRNENQPKQIPNGSALYTKYGKRLKKDGNKVLWMCPYADEEGVCAKGSTPNKKQVIAKHLVSKHLSQQGTAWGYCTRHGNITKVDLVDKPGSAVE